jgi:Family of unknown function (DUF5677)
VGPDVTGRYIGELLESRELGDLASRIYELGAALRARLMSSRVQKRAASKAAIFFFARTFKTYQAAVVLLRQGFWQDAAVLARVLREAEYQISWVTLGGDNTARLFLEDYQRNRRRVVRTLARHGDTEIKARAQAALDSTPADQALDEWWRNWWSKKRNEGIGWLADKLGRKAYRLEYAALSAFVHTSPALADFYFHGRADGAGVIVETKPGVSDENREYAQTIVFSVLAGFVDACGAFAQQMGFNFEGELLEINERIRELFVE